MDGKVPVDEFIQALMDRGYDGMLVSDHNSYNGYRAWKNTANKAWAGDFVVLKGIEYDTIDAGHILVIMPEGVKLKILELRGLPVSFLIEIVHRHGGILGPAHPCGEKYLSITNTRQFRSRLAVMDKFDFLEGFNACESEESNARAVEIAEEHGLPVFGGSDAHKRDCIGLGYTEFQEAVSCESDLIGLLKRKGVKSCSCGGEYYRGTTREKIGKANNILVQSFWFYNRIGSMLRHRKRLIELKKLYIRIK